MIAYDILHELGKVHKDLMRGNLIELRKEVYSNSRHDTARFLIHDYISSGSK